MRYSKKGGTVKNENVHGGINRLVNGVARLGAEACDARLLQRVYRHNHDMDCKLDRTSKQSSLYLEREANAAACSILISAPSPKAGSTPEVAAKDFEPMGFERAEERRAAAPEAARNTAANAVGRRQGNTRRSPPPTAAGKGAGPPGAGVATVAGMALMPLPSATGGGRTAAAPAAGVPPPSTIARGRAGAAGAAHMSLPSSTTGGRAGAGASAPHMSLPNAGGTTGQGTSFANYGGSRRLPSRQ
ncbi:unnamed protein product, partial [Hapterophycus canaliculatus]